VWWYIPVIPPVWEIEGRELQLMTSPEKVSKTLPQKQNTKQSLGAWLKWENTCDMRPWVQSPVLKTNKNKHVLKEGRFILTHCFRFGPWLAGSTAVVLMEL
jgi:hypothetical protein